MFLWYVCIHVSLLSIHSSNIGHFRNNIPKIIKKEIYKRRYTSTEISFLVFWIIYLNLSLLKNTRKICIICSRKVLFWQISLFGFCFGVHSHQSLSFEAFSHDSNTYLNRYVLHHLSVNFGSTSISIVCLRSCKNRSINIIISYSIISKKAKKL